jgi:hypothetical protein
LFGSGLEVIFTPRQVLRQWNLRGHKTVRIKSETRTFAFCPHSRTKSESFGKVWREKVSCIFELCATLFARFAVHRKVHILTKTKDTGEAQLLCFSKIKEKMLVYFLIIESSLSFCANAQTFVSKFAFHGKRK